MEQMDYDLIKQMSLDWINTFPLINCLTLRDISELYSGLIFIDLLEYFSKIIKKENYYKSKINEMKNSNDDERISKILEFIELFVNIKDLCDDSEDVFVIDVLLRIKYLFDNISLYEEIENEKVNKNIKNNEADDYLNFINKNKSTDKLTNINESIVLMDNKQANMSKNYNSQYVSTQVDDFEIIKPQNEVKEFQKIIENKFKTKKNNATSLSKLYYNDNSKENLSEEVENKDFDYVKTIKESIQKENNGTNKIVNKDNNNQLLIKESLELFLLRGINKKIDLYFEKNIKIPFYNFVKPTNPITRIDKTSSKLLSKYEYQPLITIEEKHYINGKSDIKPQNKSVIIQNELNKQVNSNKKQKLSFNSNEDKVIFSKLKKIIDWISNINIFKRKKQNLSLNYLLNLCYDGCFITDLISTLEGRSVKIQGIIRHNQTENQIKSNFNKICEFLFKKEKFPDKDLLLNLDINSKYDILNLIYCIYNFYSQGAVGYIKLNKESSLKLIEYLERINYQYNINYCENIRERKISKSKPDIKKCDEGLLSKSINKSMSNENQVNYLISENDHSKFDYYKHLLIKKHSKVEQIKNKRVEESFLVKNLNRSNEKSMIPSTVNSINDLGIRIKSWLITLGIPIASQLDLTKNVLTEFKDGLLLNQIMVFVDSKYIHRVNIDPNPIYKSISILNITKILAYLKQNSKMPLDYLLSEKEISEGNRDVILNLLLQIKNTYKKEQSINKSLNSNAFEKSPLQNSMNSIKFNELKNKEINLKGIIDNKVCRVNGVDHSKSPFFALNRNERERMLLKKESFFN